MRELTGRPGNHCTAVKEPANQNGSDRAKTSEKNFSGDLLPDAAMLEDSRSASILTSPLSLRERGARWERLRSSGDGTERGAHRRGRYVAFLKRKAYRAGAARQHSRGVAPWRRPSYGAAPCSI